MMPEPNPAARRTSGHVTLLCGRDVDETGRSAPQPARLGSAPMSRITSTKHDIDQDAVLSFFEQRAKKSEHLGPLRAVIYQDKHPDLAETRDRAEKALLLPKLALQSDDRLLDAGCGTGRWAQVLIPLCAQYVGADVSPGLIEIAKKQHGHHDNASFTVCPVDQLGLERLGAATAPFSRIACFGVFIYLNDDIARRAMHALLSCAAPRCRFVLREPVGIEARLTIKEHFSEDMDQNYNAIYRTEAELMEMIEPTFLVNGFSVVESGDVYADAALNNRAETKQRYFVLERSP